MQALMSAAAYERVKDRIAPFVGDLDIVTIPERDRYQRKGQDIPAEEVDPEIVWATLDAYRDGLLGALVGRALQGTRGQWLQTFNAGLDSPLFKQVMEKGLRIGKSNAQAVPIAEFVLAHGLGLIVPVDQQRALQASKTWASTPYREISQSHWTLIGYGSIGHEIAKRLKPFGAAITVVRRSPAEDDLADEVVTQDALPEVLPRTDVVVLACALTDETRNLADAGFFKALKPGAILINIGRGGLVDEDALKAALDRDQPAHAVLDVFQTEPLPADHWIWSHPKVRVTAHTSNSGAGTAARGDALFVANLERFLKGEPLINEASRREVGL